MRRRAIQGCPILLIQLLVFLDVAMGFSGFAMINFHTPFIEWEDVSPISGVYWASIITLQGNSQLRCGGDLLRTEIIQFDKCFSMPGKSVFPIPFSFDCSSITCFFFAVHLIPVAHGCWTSMTAYWQAITRTLGKIACSRTKYWTGLSDIKSVAYSMNSEGLCIIWQTPLSGSTLPCPLPQASQIQCTSTTQASLNAQETQFM